MSKNISRIVFTGDFFRSANGGTDQLNVVKWLCDRVGGLFTQLTSLPQEIIIPLIGQSVSEALAIQSGLTEPTLDNWAKIFWDKASLDVVDLIRRHYADALIVTIEMPPVLEDALDRADVPWIDISISPLRFMPDWAFHVKFSNHFNIDDVNHLLLTEKEISEFAGHVSSWYGPADINVPTIVFFAQTPRDRTLIHNGGFRTEKDVLDIIDSLRGGRPILIKDHPWNTSSDVVNALISAGGVTTNLNTYALLSCASVEVVTLSSSVGREAAAFGRRSTIISPDVQNWAFSGVDVLQHALSPRFWGPLFRSVGIDVSPISEPTWRPNFLRESLPPQGLDLAVWETKLKPFYSRSPEERLALTEKAINERRTLVERWAAIDTDEAMHWDARAAIAAGYLEDQMSIADFGCATMNLRRHLRPDQRYIPIDVVARNDETLVCDLNKEVPPITGATAAAFLGVIEYLFDPESLLSNVRLQYDVLVLSYCIAPYGKNDVGRREHAWVNDLTEESLLDMFKRTGWHAGDGRLIDGVQKIWRLTAA
ncbi:hypothetical protein [Allorhizobium terrae]|uniref:Capsule polysaccharide biosynthesis protein n=1 Tax=Allorhizobium terrae TaxID=1848972 RepID=A0A4S3ZRC8_9HYPH|nr:hypothetical protein [Allorhizobium terrae]THF48081.1 hypothetical protein E6C51_16585 [Allorhizobium terrae]